MNFKTIRKLENNISESKSTCKNCGHTMMMKPESNKTICTWCNCTVQNTSLTHFRYTMFNLLRMESKSC